MENYYCCACEKTCATNVSRKEQTLNVKGHDITLVVPVRACSICGEEVFDEDLDGKSLSLFYQKYRDTEHLLAPSEIKKIRQKYNLSQNSFSKLLGFGEKTITRYENGAIQDVCHDNLIRLMDSFDAFMLLWDKRKSIMSKKDCINVERMIHKYSMMKAPSEYPAKSMYLSSFSSVYSTQGGLYYAM